VPAPNLGCELVNAEDKRLLSSVRSDRLNGRRWVDCWQSAFERACSANCRPFMIEGYLPSAGSGGPTCGPSLALSASPDDQVVKEVGGGDGV